LSTISIVAMLKVSDASAIGIDRPKRQSRAQERQARQAVAEDERQQHRQDDRCEVREPQGGADQHPGDFADRAARQAVQRGADRDARERAARRRHCVVIMWVS
jgi:hypothetical protein